MLTSLFPFKSASDDLDCPLECLEKSSLLDYLDNASNVIETNPELMNSVGFGPIPDAPIVKSLSPSFNVIENYKGEDIDDNESTNSTDSTESQQSQSGKWFLDLIQSLSGWLHTSQAALDYSNNDDLRKSKINFSDEDEKTIISPKEEKEFWSEWEWVLSKTEFLAIEHSTQQANEIEEELKNLRRTANHLKQRPFFISKSLCILSEENSTDHDEDDENLKGIFDKEQLNLLENRPLSASLRSKLLRDVVNQFSDEWLQFIGRTFFQSKNSNETDEQDLSKYPIYIENYAEKPYAKNITGALVSMGFVASHGSDQSLTAQVLGDILWSWWSTLIRSIRDITTISVRSSEALAYEILRAAPVIARVWYETISNTKNLSGIGALPEQWKIKEQAELMRLKQLRAVGMIDAAFRDGPSKAGCLNSTITPERLAAVKQKLEERYYQRKKE